MEKKFFGMVTASSALLMALCLAPGGALAEASAQEYDLMNGSVTVTAKADGKQYVTQAGGVSDELQDGDTVITQSDASTVENTIVLAAEEKQTAEVTFQWVNIDASGAEKAAVSTSGDGDVSIKLLKSNVLKSADTHAGLEKGNAGNLTVTAEDTGQQLIATGGYRAAGIGAGWSDDAAKCSDITIAGGTVKVTGGWGAAGIGGCFVGSASDISITGGKVTVRGGVNGAGIGGGSNGDGTGISITGGEVSVTGGPCAAGIGGGCSGKGDDVTVAGDAQVKAQGGVEFSNWGAGAAIGCGGHMNDDGRATGAEVEPTTDKLEDGGKVKFYAPGADMALAKATKTISASSGKGSGLLQTLLSLPSRLLGR